MAITDNERIMIKVCELYYKDNLSQKEISYKLGISRPQISRILTMAKANNIVTIKIDNPYGDETALERQLIEKYGLNDAMVVNTEGMSSEQALIEVAKQAANQMEYYISSDSRIGIMSGRTISECVKQIRSMDRKGLEFIPLIGGMGSSGLDWHANIITKTFADKVSGTYSYLNSPVLVKNLESKEILTQEPEIHSVLQKGETCDLAIVGIGQVNEKTASVVAGSLSMEEVEYLKGIGAVASVCASYVNSEGKILKNDITDRSIGQTLEGLKKARKLAIALGKSKTEAIRAVLKGGFIQVLITNLETATEILHEN